MPKNRPICPVCTGKMKKNGTTSAGKTRWRCTNTHCGASTTRHLPDQKIIRDFKLFHTHATTSLSLDQIASTYNISRRSLTRRFETFWLIDVPCQPDPYRIYDQIFLDGTYTGAGCLLIASSSTHVITWHWAKTENTTAYTELLSRIPAPLCVVLDGGQGALSAIKTCWPTTKIQRCLVHAQRTVRRYTTSNPRTDAGKAIYALARKLTTITTVDQAHEWILNLHEFSQLYHEFLNEKTPLPPHRHSRRTWEYTHLRVRKAYQSLLHLTRSQWLFTSLTPPETALNPTEWKSTTNSLEGGFNSPLKLLARTHRGRKGERQRKMIDWWLHSKTQLPDDPIEIARQCNFGQDQLAKVQVLTTTNENHADQETGRPALYDNAIPTTYTHNIGIRKQSR